MLVSRVRETVISVFVMYCGGMCKTTGWGGWQPSHPGWNWGWILGTHPWRPYCFFLKRGIFRPRILKLFYYGHHGRVTIMLDTFSTINYIIKYWYISAIISCTYSTFFHVGALGHNLAVRPKPERPRVTDSKVQDPNPNPNHNPNPNPYPNGVHYSTRRTKTLPSNQS